jgi:hypothetical protein
MKVLSFGEMRLRHFMVLGVLGLAFLMSGCALLQMPFQLVGGLLRVVGTVVKGAFDLAKRLPMPPPGVF